MAHSPRGTSRVSPRSLGPWRMTAAHVRAVALAAAGGFIAVIGRRPDLIVIIAPLAVAAVWGHLERPRIEARAEAALVETTLREGAATALVVKTAPDEPDEPDGAGARAPGDDRGRTIGPPLGDVDGVVTLARTAWEERSPESGVAWLGGVRRDRCTIGVRSLRWGTRPLGTPAVTLTSAWGAYRAGPVELPGMSTTTLPLPAIFEAGPPTPHPRGLVGLNRSARPGSGSEFNTIRHFQPGDRLRRIHWPVSLRTGQLHVTSTYADEDAHVFLLVDAFSDLGPREGIDGRPTSLDVTVRAAGAISEHFLRTGDRLTLRTVGASRVPTLGVGSGTRHLRRVLETLARITPASERRDDGSRAIRGVDPMSLALVLSPLIEPTMVELAHTLAARGMATVVVDTFPPHLTENPTDVYQALAWRIRLLSRESQVHGLVNRGIPVVPWRGPGSLDHVLRDIARRASAPRMVRR